MTTLSNDVVLALFEGWKVIGGPESGMTAGVWLVYDPSGKCVWETVIGRKCAWEHGPSPVYRKSADDLCRVLRKMTPKQREEVERRVWVWSRSRGNVHEYGRRILDLWSQNLPALTQIMADVVHEQNKKLLHAERAKWEYTEVGEGGAA